MKKLMTLFCLGFLIWCPTGISSAISVDNNRKPTFSLDWDKLVSSWHVSREEIYDPGCFSTVGDLVIPEVGLIGTAGPLPMNCASNDRRQGELWKLNYDEALHNLECSRNWKEQSFSLDPKLFSRGVDSLSFNLTELIRRYDNTGKAWLTIHNVGSLAALDREVEYTFPFETKSKSPNAIISEPLSLVFLGLGLIGLAGLKRRFKT